MCTWRGGDPGEGMGAGGRVSRVFRPQASHLLDASQGQVVAASWASCLSQAPGTLARAGLGSKGAKEFLGDGYLCIRVYRPPPGKQSLPSEALTPPLPGPAPPPPPRPICSADRPSSQIGLEVYWPDPSRGPQWVGVACVCSRSCSQRPGEGRAAAEEGL